MEEDVVEWVFKLFDEIEEPSLMDRIKVLSLLLAEAESWSIGYRKGLEDQ